MKLIAAVAAFFVLSTACAYAQTPPPEPRSLHVTGEAEEAVAPDQAVLSLSLVTKDMDINKAKQQNDELVEKLVAITQNFKIPKEKVLASGISISPEYRYDNNTQHLLDYRVDRSFSVTIDKMDQAERVLSAVVDAKIDQVNGLQYQLADRESHMDALRVKAYENAKAKAETLAKAAGVQLDAPLFISVDDAEQPMPIRPMFNGMMKAAVAQPSVAPELPGLITLHESVSVSFGLK